MPAGDGTGHPGYGRCRTHSKPGEEGAWQLAFDLARELDVSPWEALLLAVRLAGGAVADTEHRLHDAERADDGAERTSPEVKYWRGESRRERTLMARTAKAAIDAGVAERIVRQAEIEGQLVAAAVVAALDMIPNLSIEHRMAALTAAQTHLFELEAAVPDTTDGGSNLPPLTP
jgi:hypothetical protein